MKLVLRSLWTNEDGAEVIEWVIVAAVLIGVAVGGYQLLGTQVENATNTLGDQLVQQADGELEGGGGGEIQRGTDGQGPPGGRGVPMRLTDGQRQLQ